MISKSGLQLCSMFASRRILSRVIQEGSRLSACRFRDNPRLFSTSAVAAQNISRFPVPEISTLPDDLQEKLTKYSKQTGFLINVFRALSHRPDELRAFLNYHEIVMARRGSLTPKDKEMIIVAISATNKCQCCTVLHGALYRIRSRNPTHSDQLSVDWRTAELDDRQRAILEVAMTINRNDPVTDEEIANLEKHGLSKEDAWDIGSTVAFFSLVNRMVSFMKVIPNAELHTMGRIPKQAK